MNNSKYSQIHEQLQSVVEQIINDEKLHWQDESAYAMETLHSIQKELNDKEFRITVIGQFSSGKSTFLNAIIGKDILVHGSNETTAAITYIHNVPVDSAELNMVKVNFYDGSCISFNLKKEPSKLADYTTTSKNICDVVKGVSSVDIYVHFSSSSDKITLIDTPGLNGVAEGLRAITENEIQKSHASLVLFHIKGFDAVDHEYLDILKKYQNAFFFILNHIDEIKSQEETVESKMAFFSKQVADIFGSVPSSHIMGISALKALTAEDENIKKLYADDVVDLTTEDRKRLWKESGIQQLKDSLDSFLSNSDLDKSFYSSIISKLVTFLCEQKKDNEIRMSICRTENKDCPEIGILEDRKSEIPLLLKKIKEEIYNRIESKVDSLGSEMRSELKDTINKEELAEIDAIYKETFDSIQVSFKNEKYKNLINNFYSSLLMNTKSSLESKLCDIFNSTEDSLVHFLPQIKVSDSHKILIQIEDKNQFEGVSSTDDITSLEKEKREQEDKLNKVHPDFYDEDIEKYKNKINQCLNNIQENIPVAHDAAVRSMGKRPDVDYYTEDVKKRFFFFFSRTDRHLYKDDSKQKSYDANKEHLDDNYQEMLAKEEEEKNKWEQRLEDLRMEQYKAENLCQDLKLRIDRLNRDIADKKEEFETQKRVAKSSWLKSRQSELKCSVEEAFAVPSGSVYSCIVDFIRDNIKSNSHRMSEDLSKKFEEKVKCYKESLNMMIDKRQNSADAIANRSQSQSITARQNKLEEYLKLIKNIEI